MLKCLFLSSTTPHMDYLLGKLLLMHLWAQKHLGKMRCWAKRTKKERGCRYLVEKSRCHKAGPAPQLLSIKTRTRKIKLLLTFYVKVVNFVRFKHLPCYCVLNNSGSSTFSILTCNLIGPFNEDSKLLQIYLYCYLLLEFTVLLALKVSALFYWKT